MSVGVNRVDKDNLPQPIIITNPRFNDVSNTIINDILFLWPCERKNKRILWLCRCHCGNYFKVEPKSVRSGNTKSCGCHFLERMREYNTRDSKDLTGMRFGKLLVLERTNFKNNRQHWKCICDCGNFFEANADSLLQNKLNSCGCLKSYAELQLKNLFTKQNIDYASQYTFSDCKSNKGYPLYFDFAILLNGDLKGLIEYQGDQHYNTANPWFSLDGQANDDRKKEYCKTHNIPLLHLYKNYNETELLTEIGRWCSQ